MNELPVTFVFTHDSIGVGEDGPTHQPVEHLMSLRAIPGLLVLRPADAAEAAEAWRLILEERRRPACLVLSRQKLTTLERGAGACGSAAGLRRGAYVLRDSADPRATLIATGSEVHLALAAQAELEGQGIGTRVVSMPSWERFAEQDAAYRDSVLDPSLGPRVSVEAGVTLGWERWTGAGGASVGIDRFGASAPGNELFEQLGFAVADVVRARARPARQRGPDARHLAPAVPRTRSSRRRPRPRRRRCRRPRRWGRTSGPAG